MNDTQDPSPGPSMMVRLRDLSKMLAVSERHLSRLRKDPAFPKGIKISVNAIIFRRDEIEAWVKAHSGNPVPLITEKETKIDN